MQLRGCGTALVTPFSQDGAVDETALRNLVAWQVESGIDFLIPCGTTGETPTLSHDEWLHVIDVTIQVLARLVPFLQQADTGGPVSALQGNGRGRRQAHHSLQRSGTNLGHHRACDSCAT